jgi:hypothetical protein
MRCQFDFMSDLDNTLSRCKPNVDVTNVLYFETSVWWRLASDIEYESVIKWRKHFDTQLVDCHTDFSGRHDSVKLQCQNQSFTREQFRIFSFLAYLCFPWLTIYDQIFHFLHTFFVTDNFYTASVIVRSSYTTRAQSVTYMLNNEAKSDCLTTCSAPRTGVTTFSTVSSDALSRVWWRVIVAE